MKTTETRRLPNGNLLVTVPIDLRWKGNGNGRRIITEDGVEVDAARDAFLLALARGRRWQKLIDEGQMGSARDIAAAIGKDVGFVARCIRITLLCPEIIERAVNGELPVGLSSNLARKTIPDAWTEQKEMLIGE